MNLHGSGSTGSVRAADRSRMDDTTGAGDTTTMHRVFSHGLDEPALTFRLPTVDESELVGDWIGRPSPAPLGRWSSRPWVTGAPWRDSSFGTPAHRVRAAVHQGRRIGFVRSFRPSGPDHPRWPGHTDPGLRVLALRVTCEEMDRRENWSRMLWGYSMEAPLHLTGCVHPLPGDLTALPGPDPIRPPPTTPVSADAGAPPPVPGFRMIGLRWRETPSRGTIVGMNSTLDAVRRLLLRDLDTLRDEIRAYPQEEQIWAAPDGIRNTAGTLALHLAGNLHHYLGTVLGGGDYVRDRPAEFGDRGRSRDELLDRIAAAREAVDRTLSELDPARLSEPFPVKVG
ncbi:MAG: hypothetical protein P8188_16475, partial [Gemmatimonadota bacterium]